MASLPLLSYLDASFAGFDDLSTLSSVGAVALTTVGAPAPGIY